MRPLKELEFKFIRQESLCIVLYYVLNGKVVIFTIEIS